jgi:outer membrane receptor protein involved in Fe transport
MGRRVRVWWGCLSLLALLATPPAEAQETRGSIEGVVKDSTGAGLPGATVEARSPSLVGVAAAVSDETGRYRFPSLSPGIYQVTASMSGFQSFKVENVRLELGQILRVELSLSLAGVSENVQVVAESPIIDVKQNAAVGSVTSELIERIPRGRNFTDLVQSAPGATPERKSGGIQIDGASGSENRFIIDGMDTTNLRTGVSQTDAVVDFIAEVQVKSSGYNAEYRATTGGVISAITKSGGNSFHGSAGTYYSNEAWSGARRPVLRSNPADITKAEYLTRPRDKQYQVDPVADIGGPIFRDRVWFFAGYSHQRIDSERAVTFTQNGTSMVIPNDRDRTYLNYNVTTQITRDSRLKFSASNQRRYGQERTDLLPLLEANGTSTANPSLYPNPLSEQRTNDFYVGDHAWVVSPKFFVNANVGYLAYDTFQVTETEFSDKLRHVFNGSNICSAGAAPGSSGCAFPEIPSSLQQLSAYADFPASTRNSRDKYGRVGLSTDATYYADFAGRHTIKGGVQWERFSNDVLTGAQAPTVTLFWNAARSTLDAVPRQVRGTYGYYTVARSYTEGEIHSNNLGVFIQDAWTLNDRLTLNLGLRTDREIIPSYRPENPGLTFGFADKFAPRVGFAYDVTGDAKSKLYGSWGVFYDIQKLEMPRGAWGAARWIDYHYTLDTFNWPSISCEGPQGSGCAGTFIEQADRRLVSNSVENPRIDPNLKPVRAQEFTLGFDHELTSTMSVGVRYAHKWLDRLIEDVGVQVAGIGEVFMIANPGYGIAEYTLAASCASCPAQPKAQRDYDGLEFRLRKRFNGRWSLNTSYLYSRIYGNTSGLASSDENGRTAPNVERAFDGMHMSFDETGKPIYGRLQTDRPHTFELQTTYDFKWGTGVAVDQFLGTGTPLQSEITVRNVPVFEGGRGNLGRTPTFSETSLSLYHDFKLGGSKRLNLNVQIFNLFDQDTVTRNFTARYRDPIPVTDTQFFGGINSAAVVSALNSDAITSNNIRPDPRFMLPDQWQDARSFRVMAKFLF